MHALRVRSNQGLRSLALAADWFSSVPLGLNGGQTMGAQNGLNGGEGRNVLTR